MAQDTLTRALDQPRGWGGQGGGRRSGPFCSSSCLRVLCQRWRWAHRHLHRHRRHAGRPGGGEQGGRLRLRRQAPAAEVPDGAGRGVFRARSSLSAPAPHFPLPA